MARDAYHFGNAQSSALLAVFAMAAAMTLLPAATASALGGESLLCRIVPVQGNPPFTPTCANRLLINGTYSAGFHVFNTSGSYTSVTWTNAVCGTMLC